MSCLGALLIVCPNFFLLICLHFKMNVYFCNNFVKYRSVAVREITVYAS